MTTAPETTRPLAGVRVLEVARTLAGAYAGRLLRDLGAHVSRWGDGPGGVSSELGQFLDLGKAAVEATSPAEAARSVGADLVVLEADDLPDGDPSRDFGGAVVVTITPWGLDGPWAGQGRPWSEFTLQAESGSMSMRGSMESFPITTGSGEPLWVAGTMAAGAGVAALQGGSEGRLIDVSLLEVATYSTNLFQDLAAAVVGTPQEPFSYRIRLSPSVEPAADGWVGFNLASAQNHQDFLVLIDRPDWLADEQMNNFMGRYLRYEEWTTAVRAWTRQHTVAEIVTMAAQFRIPCAPVHNGETILEDPQVIARDFYTTLPGAEFMVPRPPMLFGGSRPDRAADSAPYPAAAGFTGEEAPFAGLRVLDLSTWWVGAYVGSTLGAFGADVVKIESTRRIDGARTLGGVPQTQDHWWECGNFYLGANFAKRNVSLDITQDDGRALLERLISEADVLIENYAPRVLESIGLDWDGVHAINPDLVMLRMPAFGLTGPRREMVGYAQTVEQFSGLAWRTGYEGGDPTNPQGPADPMGGANAFLALAAALRHSRVSGAGMLVEAVLVEGALTMASEQVMRWTSRGELLERDGNSTEHALFQGMFAAEGDQRWVAITVTNEAQQQELLTLIGAAEPRSAPDLGARAYHSPSAEDMDKHVAAWVAGQDAEVAAATLGAAGIPAGVLRDARFVHHHPHLSARGAYEFTELPYAGKVPLPTLPFRRPDRPAWLARRPPMLGEHNHEVLGEELGLSDDELAALVEAGVIGTAPARA